MKTGDGMKETHNLVEPGRDRGPRGPSLVLNAQQMRWLLDYAAQQAAPASRACRRDNDHIEKAFLFGAMGARNGVQRCHWSFTPLDRRQCMSVAAYNFVETTIPKADPAGVRSTTSVSSTV